MSLVNFRSAYHSLFGVNWHPLRTTAETNPSSIVEPK